ncbi:MAG: endonuclease NucS, partial [Thermogladius sp.]
MIKAIKEPDLESALREVIDAIRSKEVLLLIGECEVEYEGRGYTRLSAGERVVVVKSDGALMVHRPTGLQPVNYQPRTDLVEAWIEPDGRLSLVAVRDKPREVLKVAFTKVSVLVRGR